MFTSNMFLIFSMMLAWKSPWNLAWLLPAWREMPTRLNLQTWWDWLVANTLSPFKMPTLPFDHPPRQDSILCAYFRISFPLIECLRRHIQSSFLLKCPSSSSKFIFPNQVMLNRAQTVHNSDRYIRTNSWGKIVYVPVCPHHAGIIFNYSILLYRECPRLAFI